MTPEACERLRGERSSNEDGALEYRECVAEDVPVGKLTSFPRSVKVKRGETVARMIYGGFDVIVDI